jgi:hypothetical protein
MTRRLIAAAALTAALGGAFTAAPAANAASCGPVLDHIASLLPEPVRAIYLKVCGV